MWNSFSTGGPVSVTARIETYPGGGGDDIHAYVARPDTDDPTSNPGARCWTSYGPRSTKPKPADSIWPS